MGDSKLLLNLLLRCRLFLCRGGHQRALYHHHYHPYRSHRCIAAYTTANASAAVAVAAEAAAKLAASFQSQNKEDATSQAPRRERQTGGARLTRRRSNSIWIDLTF